VFSAFGIAASDVKRVEQLSSPMRAPFDLVRWREHFTALEAALTEGLRRDRLPTAALVFTRFAHLQFRGQVHTVRVPVGSSDLAHGDGDGMVSRFVDLYEGRYGAGTAYVKAGVEAVAFSVEAVARLPKPALEASPAGDDDVTASLKHHRSVYLHELGRFAPIPVLAGDRLRTGHRVTGPALVEAEDMTVLVHPGHTLTVDPLGTIRMHLE
jgi:N-methylhydantoinase A